MHQIRFYHAIDGWRWQLVAGNGELIGESGEAYASKANVLRAVASLQAIDLRACPVIDIDG